MGVKSRHIFWGLGDVCCGPENEFKLKYHEPSIIFYDVIKAFHLHKCNCILLGINVNKKGTNYFQDNSNNN